MNHQNNTSNTELEAWLNNLFDNLYIFDNSPEGIPKVERSLEEARQAILAKFEEQERLAIDDYILVTLGWMEANRANLSVDEIIATLQAQLSTNKESENEA